MAGRSAHTRAPRISTEGDPNMRTPEHPRRSLSQGDDTPRPPGLLSQDTPSVTSTQFQGNSEQSPYSTTKRLGFLGEMLSSSSGSGTSASTLRGSQSNQLPASRSHARAESANLLREAAPSPAPTMTSSKAHPSPSKVSRLLSIIGL